MATKVPDSNFSTNMTSRGFINQYKALKNLELFELNRYFLIFHGQRLFFQFAQGSTENIREPRKCNRPCKPLGFCNIGPIPRCLSVMGGKLAQVEMVAPTIVILYVIVEGCRLVSAY